MLKKLLSFLIIILSFSAISNAQGSGTPKTLRIKIDANGYLLAAGLAQTNPVTSSLFGNARLKTDANGNLLVVITGGTITSATTISVANILTSTSTSGLTLTNPTLATAGVPVQNSPRLVILGNVWDTSMVTNRNLGWAIGTDETSGASPVGNMGFYRVVDGVYTGLFSFSSSGGISIAGTTGITFSSAGTSIGWTGTGFLTDGSANGLFLLRNNNVTAGVGLDVTTDSVLSIRNRALNADAALKSSTLFPTLSQITAGTDDTTTNVGDVTKQRYQATITPASGGAGNCATQAAGFKAAATTADCVIATLPAGVKLIAAYADVTAGFTCSSVCSGTKVFQMGITAAGVEIFAAGRNVAVTGQFGLADADMGTLMVRAAQIQGGYLPNWSGTTTITARFTSGTGNWGNGTVSTVNAGSIKFTLITELVK